MAKVYVVTVDSTGEDHMIVAVFDSEELAKELLARMADDCYQIEVFTLNELPEWK